MIHNPGPYQSNTSNSGNNNANGNNKDRTENNFMINSHYTDQRKD